MSAKSKGQRESFGGYDEGPGASEPKAATPLLRLPSRCTNLNVVVEASDGETVPLEPRPRVEEVVRAHLVLGDATGASAIGAPSVVVVGDELTIGRRKGGLEHDQGRLALADPHLSKVHARIVRREHGAWWVEDVSSLNGTWLDGRRIAEARRLSDGATLFFGSIAAVFRLVPFEGAAALEEEASDPVAPVPTASPLLAALLRRLRRLARARSEILLLGETGVGKEVYARAVHRIADRSGRFVAINCAAIPSELAESELFGYVRGAHSTAAEAKLGLIEAAAGGTLFLDEIADLSQPLQAKLLRFLEDREVTPLGATKARSVDVQIVAATTRLEEGRGAGMLRSDLTGRLGVEPLEIPPLRERLEDLAYLLPYYMAKTTARRLEPGALRAMFLYNWPRNVRELKKTLAHAAAIADDATIRLSDLPRVVRDACSRGESQMAVSSVRSRATPSRDELEALLRAHAGNVAQVARTLDRRQHVVWRWMSKHQLEPTRFRQ